MDYATKVEGHTRPFLLFFAHTTYAYRLGDTSTIKRTQQLPPYNLPIHMLSSSCPTHWRHSWRSITCTRASLDILLWSPTLSNNQPWRKIQARPLEETRWPPRFQTRMNNEITLTIKRTYRTLPPTSKIISSLLQWQLVHCVKKSINN